MSAALSVLQLEEKSKFSSPIGDVRFLSAIHIVRMPFRPRERKRCCLEGKGVKLDQRSFATLSL